uniref:Uncharacterized protein n=1 Tax=Anguilla anguilla TaxID=7936 RepID=A0A0E9SYX5_ANGAN
MQGNMICNPHFRKRKKKVNCFFLVSYVCVHNSLSGLPCHHCLGSRKCIPGAC